MVKFNKKDLELIYSRTKASFEKCVRDEENKFLENEIEIPITSIVTKEEFVKIQYLEYQIDNFVIEAKIQLLSQSNKIIGSYTYYEDESGVGIDDNLMFE